MLCGNLAIGLSYGWWTHKHNRHHSHPNTEGADPDVMLGVLAFSGGRARAGRGIQRLIFRYQAYLLFPMLLLEGIGLHTSSIRADDAAGLPEPRLGGRAALASTSSAIWPRSSSSCRRSRRWSSSSCSRACSASTWARSFAPNHKGMPVLAANDKTGFLGPQVLTSRNVRGGWLTDLALGGLNYQVEHHLFPSMPRPSLRRSQALIREFCARRDLPYTETSLVDSYVQALRYLNATGKLAAAATPATAVTPALSGP